MTGWAITGVVLAVAFGGAVFFDWYEKRLADRETWSLADYGDRVDGALEEALSQGQQIGYLPCEGERWLLWHESSPEPFLVDGDILDVVDLTHYLSWVDQLPEHVA